MAAPPLTSRRDGAAVVQAVGLVKVFGEGEAAVQALRGVDLEIPRGQFAAIMGPSGSGKSTLLHLLGGLDTPSAGEVRVGEATLSRLSDRDLTLLRRERMGFIFQFFNLLPTLTAEENVALPLMLAGADLGRHAARVGELLELVGLGARRRHLPQELSGGEQQRVAVARALVSSPDIVLADEPTGNLDDASGGEVIGLLRRTASGGRAVLVVTHDPAVAAAADRRLGLAGGRLVA
jgi:putative ABC transport system ATP-binding protein